MTQILGFAGKKQSGKNTLCNYIVAMKLAELGICSESRLSTSGDIEITDVFGEKKKGVEWIPFSQENMNVELLRTEHLDKYVKIYGLADTLKDMCVNILGLSHDQAYGTDDDKNSNSTIKWEDIPTWENSSLNKNRGFMTAREVLQYVGTDIFRKLDPDVWIKSLLRKIEKDSPELALICDVRFENEVLHLKDAGATVIGLTKDKFKGQDVHSSEALVQDALDNCSFLIQNEDMTIQQQCLKLYEILSDRTNLLPKVL